MVVQVENGKSSIEEFVASYNQQQSIESYYVLQRWVSEWSLNDFDCEDRSIAFLGHIQHVKAIDMILRKFLQLIQSAEPVPVYFFLTLSDFLQTLWLDSLFHTEEVNRDDTKRVLLQLLDETLQLLTDTQKPNKVTLFYGLRCLFTIVLHVLSHNNTEISFATRERWKKYLKALSPIIKQSTSLFHPHEVLFEQYWLGLVEQIRIWLSSLEFTTIRPEMSARQLIGEGALISSALVAVAGGIYGLMCAPVTAGSSVAGSVAIFAGVATLINRMVLSDTTTSYTQYLYSRLVSTFQSKGSSDLSEQSIRCLVDELESNDADEKTPIYLQLKTYFQSIYLLQQLDLSEQDSKAIKAGIVKFVERFCPVSDQNPNLLRISKRVEQKKMRKRSFHHLVMLTFPLARDQCLLEDLIQLTTHKELAQMLKDLQKMFFSTSFPQSPNQESSLQYKFSKTCQS